MIAAAYNQMILDCSSTPTHNNAYLSAADRFPEEKENTHGLHRQKTGCNGQDTCS